MNPFPGLRPFRIDEDHLFFGREEQTAELLSLLRRSRFTAVVGTSGSGKSSLVRAGVLPELLGGMMTGAGSAWEVAVLRPGGHPLENLSRALADADLYDGEDPDTIPNLLATLRHSGLGLIEAVRQSDLETGARLLVVVDQFEEIFRYRSTGDGAEQEAADFVNLLLEATCQDDVPVYVAITMRSDYLGDCAQFRGLAEAVNQGEYLIPQLGRDPLQRAIEGPVRVGGGAIAFRLVQELLNDVSGAQDQLPVLQHALMRSWEAWARARSDGAAADEPIDLAHYRSVGAMAEALSRHADEVYEGLADGRRREFARRLFQALTERASDNRGIRRPTRFDTLCAITGAEPEELAAVVEPFRQPGCTFLMPPSDAGRLSADTVVDISHESLMRVWRRLVGWVEDESQSARVYVRLAESAALEREGRAGLLVDPELEIAQSWRESVQPNAAWASRYHQGFEAAMDFLERSHEAKLEAEREREAARQRELEQAKALAEAQSQRAEEQSLRAEEQRRSARRLRFLLAAAAFIAAVAVVASVLAVRSAETARRAQAAAARQLYISDMNLAAQAWDEGNIGRLKAQLEKHRPSAGEADLRELAWFHWWRSSHLHVASLLHPYTAPWEQLLVSPDGSRVVAKGEFGVVNTYDPATLRRVNRSSVPTGLTDGAVMTADGAVGIPLQNNAITFYDLDSWNAVLGLDPRAHPPTEGVASGAIAIATSPVERIVVTGDWAGRIVFRGNDRQTTLDVGGQVRSLAFTPDGRRVVVGTGRREPDDFASALARSVVVLDVASRSVLQTIPTPHPVHAVAVSPDGSWVATGGGDEGIQLWRPMPEGLVAETELSVEGPVRALAFSPDGSRLASGTSETRRVDVWDLLPRPLHLTTLKGHSLRVNTVTFVGDADTLWSGGNDGVIRIWNLRRSLRSLRLAGPELPSSASYDSGAIAFAGDSGNLVFRDRENRLRRWNPTDGELDGFLDGGRRYIALTAASDGGTVAGLTEGGGLRVLDADGELLHPEVAAFDPEGASQARCRELGRPGCIMGLALSPGGAAVAWTVFSDVWEANEPRGDDGIYVRELASGRQRRIVHVGAVPAFTPDGRQLYARAFDRTVVWDLDADPPTVSHELQGWARESVAAFSPDGDELMIGSLDQTIRVHALGDNRERRTFRGHTGAVHAVSYSPDGRTVVSGGADRTVRLWDVETGQVRTTFNGHTATVVQVTFALDGRSIASLDATGEIRVWQTATAAEAEDSFEDLREGSRRGTGTSNDDWKRMLSLFPDDPRTYRARGAQRANQDRMEEALADYRRAEDLGAGGQAFLSERATLLSGVGDWDALVADADRLLELSDGKEVDFVLMAAYARDRAGRRGEAFELGRRALALRPTPHTAEQVQRALRVGAFVTTAQRDPAVYGSLVNAALGAVSRSLADGSPEPVEWRYTTQRPGEGWDRREGFDDSGWAVGASPFHPPDPAGWKPIGTIWDASDREIWLRHTFEVSEDEASGNSDLLQAPLRVIGRTLGSATVYLNGVRAGDVPVLGTRSYVPVELSPEARLRPGANLMAVHAQVGFNPFLDVGLYRSFSVDELAARLQTVAEQASEGTGGP